MIFDIDLREPRVMFLGRFQPLHDGHEKLIRTKLKNNKVMVQVRTMPKDENNPYHYSEVWQMFYERFKPEMDDGRLVVQQVPNIVKICHGRKVGWEVERIYLDEKTESISATKIRNL